MTVTRAVGCDIKRCGKQCELVLLSICAEGHIDEFYLCKEHAITVWSNEKSCSQLHPVVEHMAAKINGDEPDDTRFYQGQWVAVNKDGKVIGHGPAASDLYMDKKIRHEVGTNIYHVTEDLQT